MSENDGYHIYIIKNMINSKIYVGYSSQPERRWRLEKNAAFCKNDKDYDSPLSRAIRRIGWSNFSKEIIASFSSKEEALEAEKFWIEYYKSNRHKYGPKYGYNLHEGGGCPPNRKGIPLQPEHRRKITEANKRRAKIKTSEDLLKEEKRLLQKQKIQEILNNVEGICNEYLSGKSLDLIASQYNCSSGFINKILISKNIEIRKRREIKDLSGLKFNSWTVLKLSKIIDYKNQSIIVYECKCDCGIIKNVRAGNLVAGISTNCGCLRRKS